MRSNPTLFHWAKSVEKNIEIRQILAKPIEKNIEKR